MSENQNIQKIYKSIDIYNNGQEFSAKEGERKNFIQNKMMKFFKKISETIFFASDNKGMVYYLEFNKDTKTFKITYFDTICNDSKYILVDIIKSSKFDFYFSLNLNPCLNIFKIKDDNNNKQEIDIIQHINLRKKQNNQNKNKYNKIYEINTNNNDCFILFGDNIIELWLINNRNTNDIKYEFVQLIHIENLNNENINNDFLDSNIISNIYKKDNENLILLNLNKFQVINAKILELKSEKNNNAIIPSIEIDKKANIKAIEGQIEKINSLFMNKDYIFLGLSDSLVLISINYAEIIQKYQIGNVKQMKLTNDKKYVYAFVDKGEGKYFFIKYKFIEYEGLTEEKRMGYKEWIYKFDIIESLNVIVIYNIKGFITLLSFD